MISLYGATVGLGLIDLARQLVTIYAISLKISSCLVLPISIKHNANF